MILGKSPGSIRLERDDLPQGSHKARGVVLRRKEGSANASKSFELLLFLRAYGAMWVGAPGAGGSKNRFGAGTEPMMWGDFELYQSPRRLYLKSVDVREDFWAVRGSRASLATALGWHGRIAKKIPPRVENDALLSLLFGSMKNLASGVAPAIADVRFAWRWANLWGVAPPLDFCAACGENFFSSEPPMFAYLGPEGLICERCATEYGALRRIDAETHDLLYRAACLPRDEFSRTSESAKIDPENADVWQSVSKWLYSFLE